MWCLLLLYLTLSGVQAYASVSGVVSTLAGGGNTTLLGEDYPASGFADGTGELAQFSSPAGALVSYQGTKVYVADASNNKIRTVVVSTGAVTTLAGGGKDLSESGHTDGTGTDYGNLFHHPSALAITQTSNILYVADTLNNKIRKVIAQIGLTTESSTVGVTTSLVGGGSTGSFADRVDGTGTYAGFNGPYGLALNADDTVLYVADYGNHMVRKVTIATSM
eukprot:gene7087-8454_t